MKYIYCVLFMAIMGLKTTYGQVKSAAPRLFVDSGIVVWDYHSKNIGEDYTIYVNVPSGYDTTKTNYPVLYLTDGDWNLNMAIDCFSMLEQDYETTDPIIVAIGYGSRENMRARDFEPDKGGPKFYSFIADEVMPFINSKYRVNGNNALYGYSYGGIFATWVLFEHPDVFKTVFIGAPGNNGRDLMPAAKKYFANHTDLNNKVFVGVGSYEHETAGNIDSFKTYLLNKSLKNLDLKTAIAPDAGHGTALAAVMQSAMKFGYCKTHTEIHQTAEQLKRYTGSYTLKSMPKIKFRLFTVGDALYFQQGDNLPVHFVPCGDDSFFMYENELTTIYYKESDGKKYMLAGQPGQKLTRLDKID